jgi:hypothetical protein
LRSGRRRRHGRPGEEPTGEEESHVKVQSVKYRPDTRASLKIFGSRLPIAIRIRGSCANISGGSVQNVPARQHGVRRWASSRRRRRLTFEAPPAKAQPVPPSLKFAPRTPAPTSSVGPAAQALRSLTRQLSGRWEPPAATYQTHLTRHSPASASFRLYSASPMGTAQGRTSSAAGNIQFAEAATPAALQAFIPYSPGLDLKHDSAFCCSFLSVFGCLHQPAYLIPFPPIWDAILQNVLIAFPMPYII